MSPMLLNKSLCYICYTNMNIVPSKETEKKNMLDKIIWNANTMQQLKIFDQI